MSTSNYRVKSGPEGFLPPAAATCGVNLPEKGNALIEGVDVPAEEAMLAIVKKLLNAVNPVIFPGPLLLWDWKDGVREKAKLVKEFAEVIGARIIPMPDYRPKYPMINPEIEINPNHPNLTIWHNKID
ncbi:MAG TPA: carbon monoxide dehydrogenase beta subunit family protein, partial [Acidobacteriota bacterium]|nr:carbon monoxide dehydrogenase beta subunit family protein [Acidobacteriota bacterium]